MRNRYTTNAFDPVNNPTLAPPEQEMGEMEKDNDPNAYARELGLWLIRPLNASSYRGLDDV